MSSVKLLAMANSVTRNREPLLIHLLIIIIKKKFKILNLVATAKAIVIGHLPSLIYSTNDDRNIITKICH